MNRKGNGTRAIIRNGGDNNVSYQYENKSYSSSGYNKDGTYWTESSSYTYSSFTSYGNGPIKFSFDSQPTTQQRSIGYR
jgi:hypothetical protein